MPPHPVGLLPTLSPQFADWKDLVVRDVIDDVQEALREFADLAVPTLAPSKERLFPPPDLYFERTIKKVIYMFKTNLDSGLSSDAIPALREHYGKNDLAGTAETIVSGRVIAAS
ncbi:hypothetical protein AMAG_17456 [Allomyces macrogynus ATCC 38327]|uniref:Cation-transporting P-type ATPase N-terminal domain-containing protein n=1 Tax=Allomyces macrogynus (strain ATCC 38327) TaxID=578462 RepID=A0A0L0TF14_ALLM3|nr:hypothetical protein AMAG_17456 [Allomyces macrogynus ATCC 38327]|eukprot:KNE73290.1 hypothetical protein AMAG_17456 [Allomyces macrogynus ATCC 38327]